MNITGKTELLVWDVRKFNNGVFSIQGVRYQGSRL